MAHTLPFRLNENVLLTIIIEKGGIPSYYIQGIVDHEG